GCGAPARRRTRRFRAWGAERLCGESRPQPASGNHPAELTVSSWLRNRWLLGGLGLAAFALVAWFTGDLVALGGWRPFETETGRAALIAAAAAAWLGWEWWRARCARQENERLLEVLASGGETDSGARAAREIAVLRQRFEEAAAVLKKARFKGPDGE